MSKKVVNWKRIAAFAIVPVTLILLLSIAVKNSTYLNLPSLFSNTTNATNNPLTLSAKTTSGVWSAPCHSVDGKPDPVCTPGAANPNVTQANIRSTICVSGYTTKIRPSTSYTNKLKTQQIKLYGYTDTKLSDYEEDHLIPLEVGGDPTNPKNLWPEPYNVPGNNGSYSKDKVENLLHKEVCNGQISLQQAQYEISTNWEVLSVYASVNTVPTPQPTTSPVTTNQNGHTALCKDGTYSDAKIHQGACSSHKGVAIFYK